MTTEDQYRMEYNNLLDTISEKLNANDLRKLVSMCRGMISTANNNFDDAMAVFQELENAKKLGVDRLDILKTFLKLQKKNAQLKKVEEFEMRRKAYRSGILPSLRNVATEVLGVIKIVCSFSNIGKGLLLLGTGLALHCCSNRDEYIDTFNRVVLPTATKLIGTNVNSLCFMVQAETVQALETLWKQYQDGTLQKRLQQFLKTDNESILQLIGEDVQFAVSIEEQEYKNALLDLMIQQTKVFNKYEEAGSRERNRRTSDSILYVKSNENEMTFVLLELKEAEIKFQQEKIERLERDISGKFEAKSQEASGLGTEPLDETTEGRSAEALNVGESAPLTVYVEPEESKATVALLKLKQAKIKFQEETISSQKENIATLKAKVEELEQQSDLEDDFPTAMSASSRRTPLRRAFFQDFGHDLPAKPSHDAKPLQNIQALNIDATETAYHMNLQTDELRAEAGREVHLSFETTDAERKRYYNDDDQIMVKIHAPSGNFLKKKIEDSVDGTYTVSFTPNNVGPHSVLITVNGKPLAGSPWSVQVFPHKYKRVLKFGLQRRRWSLFDLPCGISINEDTGCIAVVYAASGGVQIFNADGSHLTEFETQENESLVNKRGGAGIFELFEIFDTPASVAFTKNGDLIVVFAGMISLFSASGQFIKHITNMHLKDAWCLSLAPDGNITIYDEGDGNIKVLSPDGAELLQSFSAYPPNDIIYHQEMFFASYFFLSCVKVYNREGVFLYDIGSEGSDDGKLSYPYGLAIDKFNNLIVCDSHKNRLQVFTLDGQFVNAIGGMHTELDHPRAVAVSKTGCVYVTDTIKRCAHVFQ